MGGYKAARVDACAAIVDACAAITAVMEDAKPDDQEPLLEMNGPCVGLLGCNVPKEFYIPLGRLRIGKRIGAGGFGVVKVGRSCRRFDVIGCVCSQLLFRCFCNPLCAIPLLATSAVAFARWILRTMFVIRCVLIRCVLFERCRKEHWGRHLWQSSTFEWNG